MHRHGYQGRKLRRERDQRTALIKGLATQLVEHGAITTTLPKAKEVVPYIEKLITKAKSGGLHNRRQVVSGLTTVSAAHRLVDTVAPQLGGRTSGHVRIVRSNTLRVGDNAEMARVSFVDDIKDAPAPQAAKEPVVAATVKPAAKPRAKTTEDKK